jgi:L-asparaginase/beta-aspartyl-peptidase (threonine type)
LGSVAALRDVRNPILVARAVADTPHWLLAGTGAYEFARAMGFVSPFRPTDMAQVEHRKTMQALAREPADEQRNRFRQFWNFNTSWQEVVDRYATGTVGAVALDHEGHFAAGASTGGSMPALMGRVGDTPIIGCGFYAGPEAAIAATGVGEHIVPHLLARTAYGWLQSGMTLQQALNCARDLLPPHSDIGLIGVSRTEVATASRPHMPIGVIRDDQDR